MRVGVGVPVTLQDRETESPSSARYSWVALSQNKGTEEGREAERGRRVEGVTYLVN